MIALLALAIAAVSCGGGASDTKVGPTAVQNIADAATMSVDEVVGQMETDLREENAEHFTFGCVDVDGTFLEGDYLDALPSLSATLDLAVPAVGYWAVGTLSGSFGDSPGYITLYDPDSGPNAVQDFRRVNNGGAVRLVCLVPE